MIIKVLNAVYPAWRMKLYGFSSDGENKMTGRIGGVATLLQREAEYDLVRVWCGPHQIDLVVKKVLRAIYDGRFKRIAHLLSVWLRGQHNFMGTFSKACPKDTTRWAYFGNALKWFIEHRARIMAYCAAQSYRHTPEGGWWVICYVIRPVIKAINDAVVSLQRQDLDLGQQRDIISSLIMTLQTMYPFVQCPPDLDEENARANYVNPDAGIHSPVILLGNGYCINQAAFVEVITETTFVSDYYDASDDRSRASALVSLAEIVNQFYFGICSIHPQRDSNNGPVDRDRPRIFPKDLAKLSPRAFREEIFTRDFRERLAQVWPERAVECVEEEHKMLFCAYSSPAFRAVLDSHTPKTPFNTAWDQCGADYIALRSFAAGFATVFPGSSTVEAEFSRVKFICNPRRASLSDYSLEGVLQAAQFESLTDFLKGKGTNFHSLSDVGKDDDGLDPYGSMFDKEYN
jgi:hypothetical protein